MKKFLSVLLAGLMLAGCGTATSEQSPVPSALPEEAKEAVEQAAETVEQAAEGAGVDVNAVLEGTADINVDLKILSPSGAPALSLVPAVVCGAKVDFVEGADPLQAAFVNPEPEYDVIVAPSNLGMKLAEAGKSPYKMLGIVTWGNLYIVGPKGTAADASTWTNVASFGEQSVTGKVFSEVYGEALDMSTVTWYNSTADASAALMAGNADVAMLAEPNATAIIAKAKESGKELEIIDDVQSHWGDGSGFPQAALFVREDAYAEKKADIDGLFAVMNVFSLAAGDLGEEAIVKAIESAGGAEALGIPNAQIVAKVWKRLNIKVVRASEHIEELKKFGGLFGIADTEATIIK